MPETAQFVYGALGIAYELTGEFFQTIKYYTQNLAILKEWATWRFLPKEVGARCANLGNAYQSRAEQRFDSLKECRLPHRGDENDSRKRMQTKHPKTACLPKATHNDDDDDVFYLFFQKSQGPSLLHRARVCQREK